jgi:circadian clock protein KaiC
MSNKRVHGTKLVELSKVATGIQGFDEITHGGLPKGRPSLICGTAGCGKTLFSIEFLIRGAMEFNEPGVFIAFEETADELAKNVASLGFDLNHLIRTKKIFVDHIHIDPNEIQENGEYDLEGLFVRLADAIATVGAKRVAMDTIEALFSGFANQAILRSELRRLFHWLKLKGVTAVITAERGEGALTRHGLEEYVADCVTLLDQRIHDQVSTRRLRVIKYRGSHHGTDEYPFLIDQHGISVLPISSLGLKHQASTERLSTGIGRLDEMLGGRGFYRGSSILISGTAGSGKSSLAANFVAQTCRDGGRALYFAFEESPSQIRRNMRSIGIDLEGCEKRKLLQFHAVRPYSQSLEMHLLLTQQLIARFKPEVVVFDPITNLCSGGTEREVQAMLTRLIDYLKVQQITAMFTSLTSNAANPDQSEIGISSLMDTWLLVRNLEVSGERNRGLYILKSRGMAHSNQVREFVLSNRGLELVDVYTGSGGFLTGAARVAQEAHERSERMKEQQTLARRMRDSERKRSTLQAQIIALQAELQAEMDETTESRFEEGAVRECLAEGKRQLARSRAVTYNKEGNGKLSSY